MKRRRSSRWGGFSRRRGNSRALALGVMLFILAITIAPPIKHYFTQRAQISALNNQLSSNKAALEEARKELQLWRDPEYINRITAARMRHKRELHRLKGVQRELRMSNKWRVVT